MQLGKAAAAAPVGDNWVPVCRPEDLPKGKPLRGLFKSANVWLSNIGSQSGSIASVAVRVFGVSWWYVGAAGADSAGPHPCVFGIKCCVVPGLDPSHKLLAHSVFDSTPFDSSCNVGMLWLYLLCAGVRKEFDVEGRQVLMFWYRNEIYAIEARSPAEGAYSEGFIRAKFTQVGIAVHKHGCSWPECYMSAPPWPVSCTADCVGMLLCTCCLLCLDLVCYLLCTAVAL